MLHGVKVEEITWYFYLFIFFKGEPRFLKHKSCIFLKHEERIKYFIFVREMYVFHFGHPIYARIPAFF